MELRFGLYPRFYARRKDLLLPLIEEYYGQPVKGMSHGRTIQVYFDLLRSNPEFKAGLDALIAENTDKLLTGREKKQLKESKVRNAVGVVSNIANAIGNIFGFAEAKVSANAADDQAFYEIVLAEQKKDDTIKVLIVSGIVIAFIGIMAYVVIKTKKTGG